MCKEEKAFMKPIITVDDALKWFAEDPKFESGYRKPVNCNLPESFRISNEPLNYYNELTTTEDFEHDSSPEAWIHYHKHYTAGSFGDKKNNNGTECEYCLSHLRYRYCVSESQKFYVLFAVQNQNININECERAKEDPRLRGDCDFNFKNTRKRGSGKASSSDLELLEHCRDMHHTLLNFSLMQARGNLQGKKKTAIVIVWIVFCIS